MKKRRVIGLALAAITAPAYAEPPTDPFGFQFGSPISNYQCDQTPQVGQYLCRAPRPHPEFHHYFVLAMPAFGVCGVTAIRTEEDRRVSIGVRDKTIEQISKRFGLNFKTQVTDLEERYFDFSTHDGYAIQVIYTPQPEKNHVGVLFSNRDTQKCEDDAQDDEAGSF